MRVSRLLIRVSLYPHCPHPQIYAALSKTDHAGADFAATVRVLTAEMGCSDGARFLNHEVQL